MTITDDMLSAYLDGELSADDRARVDAALAQDPALAARLKALDAATRRFADAIRETDKAPLPAGVEDLLRPQTDNVVAFRPKRREQPKWVRPAAMAASILALVVAVGMFGAGPGGAKDQLIIAAGPVDRTSALHRALDRTPSAETASIGAGRLSPVATFRIAGGGLCREFLASQKDGAVRAVACRDDRQWTVKIAATEAALQLWADVCNITFVRVNPDGYTNNASILFANYTTGAEGAAAFAYYPWPTGTGAGEVAGDGQRHAGDPEPEEPRLPEEGAAILVLRLAGDLGRRDRVVGGGLQEHDGSRETGDGRRRGKRGEGADIAESPAEVVAAATGAARKKGSKGGGETPSAVEEPAAPAPSVVPEADALEDKLPSPELLTPPPPGNVDVGKREIEAMGQKLMDALATFRVQGTLVGKTTGPVVTQYEIEPAAGVKVRQFANLANDLALAMRAASIRVVAPIPGRGAVGVEVPNPVPQIVAFRELIDDSVHAIWSIDLRWAQRSCGPALPWW